MSMAKLFAACKPTQTEAQRCDNLSVGNEESHEAVIADDAALPPAVKDWPVKWQRKLRYNAKTMQIALGFPHKEAVVAAEAGTRMEYQLRQRNHGLPDTSSAAPPVKPPDSLQGDSL